MRRIRTKLEYHDSNLVDVNWAGDDLTLTFDLCYDPTQSSVLFGGVRNRKEIEAQLQEFERKMTHAGWLADVVAIARGSDGRYLVDTSQGPLWIDARAMLELTV